MFFSIAEMIPSGQYSSKGRNSLRQPEQVSVAGASLCLQWGFAQVVSLTLPKGFRVSSIAFGGFQMAGHKNDVKCCLDLVKHHSSPYEESVGFLLSFGPLFMTFSFHPKPLQGHPRFMSGTSSSPCMGCFAAPEELFKQFLLCPLKPEAGGRNRTSSLSLTANGT